ncbi:MAG: DUF3868 domain-containing protein [Alistipes sp.]|nr:DUF3868 domain-containing protein [Alistipes sp.]
MKHIVKHLLIVCIATLGITSAIAQTVTTNNITIKDIDISQSGNRVYVDMTIDLSNAHIKSNKSLRITPIIADGNQMIQLPAVMIDGRRRHMVHQRGEITPDESNNIFVRRKNRTTQEVDYEADVAYEAWMDNSELIIREEWCSCHDAPYAEELIAVAQMHNSSTSATSATTTENNLASASPTTASPTPKMAYAIPQAGSPSATTHNAEIFFPINKSMLNTTYMSNTQEIDTLRQLIAGSSEITGIKLIGYASPEGPYQFNENLAAHRANAVKDYITKNNIAGSVPITTESAPIDWQALKQMLTNSRISNYLKIIAIIDDPQIKPADKNSAIQRQYPVEYKFMFRTWYPKLRKTDIDITHKPKQLDIAAAKQQLQVDPSQLSLGDIYMVALTYEQGSKEWNDIILLAVQTYPNVAEARVNAANVAMANGNYTQAAAYLQGLPSNMPEAMNSRGILAMSKGDYQQALALFEAAQKAGVSEATYNISLVKELMSLKS